MILFALAKEMALYFLLLVFALETARFSSYSTYTLVVDVIQRSSRRENY